MLSNPPRDAELLGFIRQAFLLEQVNLAPGGTITRGQANKQISRLIQKELMLTVAGAGDLREALSSQGYLTERKTSRSVIYTLTDDGRAWLEIHREYIPSIRTKPTTGKKAAPEPKSEPKPVVHVPIQVCREGYLLLHLLDAPDEGRTASELRKQVGSKQLKLDDEATAAPVLSELIERQFITVTHLPRSDKYSLTPIGQLYLFTLSIDASVKVTLSGSALTQLLQAARNGTASTSEPVSKTSVQPTTAQLEAAAMEIFAELRRNLNTKLVPIHKVRSAIRNKFGAEATAHAVFDEVILNLRRSKKLRLISISDKSEATPEQLRDSIVSVGETFFYLENMDASASG